MTKLVGVGDYDIWYYNESSSLCPVSEAEGGILYVNGIQVAREGQSIPHGTLAGGSSVLFINGQPASHPAVSTPVGGGSFSGVVASAIPESLFNVNG